MRTLLLMLAVGLSSLAADMTKLEIHVKNEDGKPVDRAAVTVRFKKGINPIKMRKIQKAWELRTTQEGVAKIPQIPKGQITIFVTAKNHQTFGDTFDINEDERLIEVVLKPPQAQFSVHQ